MTRATLSLGLCLVAALSAAAEFDPWFGDGMVLQRDQPIRIVGTAPADTMVEVRLGDARTQTKSGQDGRWATTFPARAAQATPLELEARDAAGSARARDVLIGDVWLCAGQSNMEFPLARDAAAKTELPQATLPLVRLRNHTFAGQYRYGAPLPAEMVARMTEKSFYVGRWEACTPKSASPTTAVGYYFAKRVAAETGVPIGLVNYAVGGAPIEAFIDRATLAADPVFRKKVTGNWLDNESIEGTFVRLRGRQHIGAATNAPGDDCGPNHGFKPGFAWEAGPAQSTAFAIRGVLWYQGESNAIRPEDVAEYGPLMKLLVADWRARWRQPTLPFYWVQLPAIDEPARQHWPEFREVQRRLANELPQTGMAVALDLGAAKDVHPRNKSAVGERLAALALRDLYGRKDLIAEGPVALGARRTPQGLRILFRALDGIKTATDAAPSFEVRRDGETAFRPVTTWEAKDSELHLTAEGRIAEVRYAWHMGARAELVDRSGRPASPFRLAVEE